MECKHLACWVVRNDGLRRIFKILGLTINYHRLTHPTDEIWWSASILLAISLASEQDAHIPITSF